MYNMAVDVVAFGYWGTWSKSKFGLKDRGDV